MGFSTSTVTAKYNKKFGEELITFQLIQHRLHRKQCLQYFIVVGTNLPNYYLQVIGG
jgi:hypothetical protein